MDAQVSDGTSILALTNLPLQMMLDPDGVLRPIGDPLNGALVVAICGTGGPALVDGAVHDLQLGVTGTGLDYHHAFTITTACADLACTCACMPDSAGCL